MKKLLSTTAGKLAVFGGGALVLVAAVLVLVFSRSGYRSVQVYQLDGTAQVQRESAGALQAYVNMRLENGDRVETREASWLYLKADDDKYMLAEPLTRFTLEATGSSRDSRTKLTLEEGALDTHVTRKLSAQSSYEVSTPNSTMAVRGTSFRILVWYDGQGVSHTLLKVFDGTVEVHLVYPDGSLSQEGRRFTAGQSVTIWGDDETSDYDRSVGVDYYSLEIETLTFLKIGISESEDGQFQITVPELDEIVTLKQTRFTVSFLVGEELFGTQSVLYDQTAHAPSLLPDLLGHWDFDFDTPIREDVTIRWRYDSSAPEG